jgi:hypothetical protein
MPCREVFMGLAVEVQRIRDHTLAALVATHNYYDDTRRAWDYVKQSITGGYHFAYTNATTGTVTTQLDLLGRINLYATKRIAEATFGEFVSIFERFLGDFVRVWLRAYPQNLLATEPVPVDVILEANDKSAITEYLIDRAIIGLLYRKPVDWFAFVEKRLKLGCPTADEIARVAEAKATRDVVVHNNGVINETYLTKSGSHARYKLGEFIDLPDQYHNEILSLYTKVVSDVCDSLCVKFP